MQDLANKPMGVRKLASAYGVIGFIRFTSHYYIYLVTKQKLIGTIGPHKVYSIVETMNIPVPHPLFQEPAPADEDRYRSLFFRFDLTQDFYYSPTYPLTYTLQYNMLSPLKSGQSTKYPAYNDMFAWNHFLLAPMIEVRPFRPSLPFSSIELMLTLLILSHLLTLSDDPTFMGFDT